MDAFGIGPLLAVGALVILGLAYEALKGVGVAGDFGRLIECLFERHKFVRRASIFWLFALVTHGHIIVYRQIAAGALTTQDAALHGGTLGLVATLTAWYMQVRKHEDAK